MTTNDEWLTTPGQLDRSRDEIEGRALPTLESVVLVVVIAIAVVTIAFLAGLVHQLKPDFFPAIWEAITTWGGVWSRIG